jgi:hypothetical protein
MNVSSVREIKEGIYPVLELIVDGKRSLMGLDQKRTLLEEYGVVFLGADFEQDYQVTIPEDDANNQPKITLRGFTDDPDVVQPYLEFLEKYGG